MFCEFGLRMVDLELGLAGTWWWWSRADWWHKGADVDEPCTSVEFGVGSLDEEWLIAGGAWNGLQNNDTGDGLRSARRDGCAPAEDDGVARVPEVELPERSVSTYSHTSFDLSVTYVRSLFG